MLKIIFKFISKCEGTMNTLNKVLKSSGLHTHDFRDYLFENPQSKVKASFLLAGQVEKSFLEECVLVSTGTE